MQTRRTIGIVGGGGVMGRVFAREFSRIGHTVLVSDPAVSEGVSLSVLLKKSDIVIVSVPLALSEQVVRDIAPRMREGQLLCDFTSIKEPVCTAMRSVKSEAVGLHPMFGGVRDVAGLSLFACPVRTGPLWKECKKTLTKELGLCVHTLTPKQHDKRMALHQSMHHILALSLADMLARTGVDVADFYAETTPSMRLALLMSGRILSQQMELYRDIELLNPATPAVVRHLQSVVDAFADIVTTKDAAQFAAVWQRAHTHFGAFAEVAYRESEKAMLRVRYTEAAPLAPQKKGTSAVLGPATQTALAAQQYYQQAFAPVYVPTITAAVALLAARKVSEAFVPLENYSIGPVRETIRALHAGGVYVSAVHDMRVRHALCGDALQDATMVVAHPQAYAQSEKTIRSLLPTVRYEAARSAGEALERARTERGVLAIAPAEEAEKSGVSVLQNGIEDDAENTTRFVVLTQKQPRGTCGMCTFFFTENLPGQLARALAIIASRGVNLKRLESIPDSRLSGAYFFFAEYEGGDTQGMLRELGEVSTVRVVGAW